MRYNINKQNSIASMLHTTKFVLVPATPNSLSAETELKKILDNSALHTDLKLAKCQEYIEKHLKTEPKNSSEFEQILSTIPKKYKNNAQLLLSFVEKNPFLKFNELGEMLFNGKLIKGSNLLDLVHDFSRKRLSKNPATGATEFIQALSMQNIPKESIVNTDRWSLLNTVKKTNNKAMKKWKKYG